MPAHPHKGKRWADHRSVVLLADSRRRPLAMATSPGQRGDIRMFEPLMAGLRLPRTRDRLRTRPARLLGDKAYLSAAIRAHLRARTIKATIAPPRDQRANHPRRAAHAKPRDGDQVRHEDRGIKGFRSFGPEPTTIGFGDISYILGPNGSGKAAVLEALSRLFSPLPAQRKIRLLTHDS